MKRFCEGLLCCVASTGSEALLPLVTNVPWAARVWEARCKKRVGETGSCPPGFSAGPARAGLHPAACGGGAGKERNETCDLTLNTRGDTLSAPMSRGSLRPTTAETTLHLGSLVTYHAAAWLPKTNRLMSVSAGRGGKGTPNHPTERDSPPGIPTVRLP